MENIKNTPQVRQTRLSNLYLPTSRHRIKHTLFSHIFFCTRYYFFNDNEGKVSLYRIFTYIVLGHSVLQTHFLVICSVISPATPGSCEKGTYHICEQQRLR